MKLRRALLPVAVAPLALATACAHVETQPQFDAVATAHDSIAALPPAVDHTRRRLPRKVTPADVAAAEQADSDIFHRLVVQEARLRGDAAPPPSVQSAPGTRDRLERAGITDVHALSPQEAADLLGVDAIVVTNVEVNRTMSDGAAVVLEVLSAMGGTDGFVPTHDIDVRMTLVDGESGAELWSCEHGDMVEITGDTGQKADTIIRECAAELPYE